MVREREWRRWDARFGLRALERRETLDGVVRFSATQSTVNLAGIFVPFDGTREAPTLHEEGGVFYGKEADLRANLRGFDWNAALSVFKSSEELGPEGAYRQLQLRARWFTRAQKSMVERMIGYAQEWLPRWLERAKCEPIVYDRTVASRLARTFTGYPPEYLDRASREKASLLTYSSGTRSLSITRFIDK